jgi:hypothetical protein
MDGPTLIVNLHELKVGSGKEACRCFRHCMYIHTEVSISVLVSVCAGTSTTRGGDTLPSSPVPRESNPDSYGGQSWTMRFSRLGNMNTTKAGAKDGLAVFRTIWDNLPRHGAHHTPVLAHTHTMEYNSSERRCCETRRQAQGPRVARETTPAIPPGSLTLGRDSSKSRCLK